jgi:hypothetical protein
MRKRQTQKPQKPRSRAGMLPGEAKRQSLVSVEAVSDEPGKDRYGNRDLMHPEHYIVSSHRLDGVWMHYVEYRGDVWRMPGKVYDAMKRHRESIITEQRRATAKERHARLAQVGEADQVEAEAEAERAADLGGQ